MGPIHSGFSIEDRFHRHAVVKCTEGVLKGVERLRSCLRRRIGLGPVKRSPRNSQSIAECLCIDAKPVTSLRIEMRHAAELAEPFPLPL